MRRIVRDFSSYCATNGIHPLLLIVDSRPDVERIVLPACHDLDIPYVRASTELTAWSRRTSRRITFEHDDHWNADAHAYIADLLLDVIDRQGWVPFETPTDAN
jgi:hypothetical protein